MRNAWFKRLKAADIARQRGTVIWLVMVSLIGKPQLDLYQIGLSANRIQYQNKSSDNIC